MEIPAALKTYSQFGHPLLMWLLLALSVYAFYLGWQSRRIRSVTVEERKEMVKKQFTAKHHQIGALLLALVVTGTIGGMTVTYINNGKLFVGPHLIAGLGMMLSLVLAAALVPWMQKGKEWARSLHIALNVVMVGLFGWQAITGMQILQRIIERMS